MGGSPASDTDADQDGPHDDVVDYPPDPPIVETLKGIVRSVQLAGFFVLVLAPLVGGFLVPLGPPTYHIEIAAVNPAGAGTADDARQYDALPADSRAVFDRVLADRDNALNVRTSSPPWILSGESTTVLRDGLAFRFVVENRGPPLRFPAIVAGTILSSLAAIAGYFLTEWDPV